MGNERTQLQKAVFRRVDEILHYIWDPIGVSGSPEARDEYQSFGPKVAGFLFENKEKEELVAYLLWLESEHMGLSVTMETRAHTREVVEILFDHFEWLHNKEQIQEIGGSKPTQNSGGNAFGELREKPNAS